MAMAPPERDAAPTSPQSGGGGRKKRGRDVSGILLLDKPTGITSNRALQQAKRIFDARKAGHTGSLDPLASGMLPLCFGQATKVSGWLLDAAKVYEVEAAIGAQTDTADADGTVIATSAEMTIDRPALAAAIAQHLGVIQQVPPMYSALKHNGRRLYELARAGVEVERPAREVTIYALEILHFDPLRPRLRVHCSKGTYVRTLVETLAAAMGTLGHVAALRRTTVEPFADQPMVSLEQLEAYAGDQAQLDSLLLPADTALQAYPAVQLAASESLGLRNGHAVAHASDLQAGPARLYDASGEFIGLGEILEDGQVAPRRLFVSGPT
jgi:tRNA pseudouridine55 synthase